MLGAEKDEKKLRNVQILGQAACCSSTATSQITSSSLYD